MKGEQLVLEGRLQKKAGKYMLTYIIALTLIVILLFGAVYAHMSFGFHQITKMKSPQVARTPHLHDLIFSKY